MSDRVSRLFLQEFNQEFLEKPLYILVMQILVSFGLFVFEHAKKFRNMDESLSSYFAMKGLIDLRVSNILAKQAYLHNLAAQEQASSAKLHSLKAGKLAALADAQEKKQVASTFKDEDQADRVPVPMSFEHYTRKSYEPTLLPAVMSSGVVEWAPLFLLRTEIINFIYDDCFVLLLYIQTRTRVVTRTQLSFANVRFNPVDKVHSALYKETFIRGVCMFDLRTDRRTFNLPACISETFHNCTSL